MVQKIKVDPVETHRCYVTTYDPLGEVVIPTQADGPAYNLPPASLEIIDYENGRTRFNRCTHIKYRYYHEAVSTKVLHWYGSYDGYTSVYTDNLSEDFCYYDYVSPAVRAPNGGLEQFVRRAYQNIRPKFKGEVSVPNFLYELKDLKRTLPSRDRIAQLAKSLSNIAINPFSKRFKRAKRKAGRGINDLSNELAGQYLSANFGYLPLIDDVFKLVGDIQHFNQRLDTFILYSKKPQVGHYTEIVPAYEVDLVNERSNWFERFWHKDSVSDARWTCTIKYGYEVLIPKLNVPTIFLRYLGLRSNPRIIWDALPFSFVIDWIFRLGKFLEAFDTGAIPVRVGIIACCVSQRYNGVVKHYRADVPNSTASLEIGADPQLQCTEGYEVYKRWIVEPTSAMLNGLPPLPVTDNLSVKEITLAAALGKTIFFKGRR